MAILTATTTEIANLALSNLGAKLITSLDENTETATRVRTYWDQSILELLAEENWIFALKRSVLTLDTSSDNHTGFENCYNLPADLVRPVLAFETDTLPSPASWDHLEEGDQEWLVENARFYTDIDDAILMYVYENSDASKWPVWFSNALSALLAYRMCFKFTQSRPLVRDLFQLYQDELISAKGKNRISHRYKYSTKSPGTGVPLIQDHR